MAKLIGLNINVTKLNKDRFYKGENGTYASMDVWIDQEADEDWKIVSVSESLSKEERDQGTAKNFVGKGKLLYGWRDQPSEATERPQAATEGVIDESVPF